MKTIAVVSSKGGSGKTTVALNLAAAAWRRGRRVLVADIDPQRSITLALKARANGGPQAVFSTGGKLFQIQQTAMRAGLDLLVVDTPGHVEGEIAEAMRIADLCVLVARPTFLDLAAAAQTTELLRRFDKPALLAINQAPPKRLGQDAPVVGRAAAALRMAGVEPAPLAMSARAAYQASVSQGLGVEEWPGGEQAAAEISSLWAAVDQRLDALTRVGPGARPAFIPARQAPVLDLAAFV